MINSTNRLDCYHFEKRERFLRPPLIADNFTNFPLLLFLLLRLRPTNDAGLKIVFPTNYYSCSTATSLMSASARFHKTRRANDFLLRRSAYDTVARNAL